MGKKQKADETVNVDQEAVQEETQEGAGTPARKPTSYTTVKMDDDRIVEFPGKRRLLKSSQVSSDGFTVSTRFDFVNGETRTFKVEANSELFAKFVGHGIEQKIGDEVAGLTDPDDMVMAIDAIMDRLGNGQWIAPRESSGMAGISVLAKALIQQSGKSPAEVKEFLAAKTNEQKLALRKNPRIAPIIAELEANKKKKVREVPNTDHLLDELQ